MLIHHSYEVIGDEFRAYFSVAAGVLPSSLAVSPQIESSTVLPTQISSTSRWELQIQSDAKAGISCMASVTLMAPSPSSTTATTASRRSGYFQKGGIAYVIWEN